MSRRVPALAALFTLVLHLAANPHYGFFRDELYFIICGFHPAWGYVDQPPVVPLLAAASQLFGHSLFALRALPAIFAAAGVYVTCLLAIEMGGGIFAQVLGALAFLAAGVLESFGAKVGPDMVGLWLWPLAALYVLRIVKGGDARLWLAAGAAIGVSLESKYSVLFFAVALVIGLLLTPQRRILATPWFLAGTALALLVALPNFLWQALHGFPMWELLRNGQQGKNVAVSPALFLFQQLLLTNLFAWPIWFVGLIALLRDGAARFLGYAYILLIAMMIALHAKHYYPADVYPILMAAGGVAVERWVRSAGPAPRDRDGRRCGLVLLRALLAAGALRAGNGALLGVRRSTVAYSALGDGDGASSLLGAAGGLGRHARLARTDRDDCEASTVRCRRRNGRKRSWSRSNYGEAAAVDFFGGAYGLPPAISGHNNYWLWGTHGYSGNVIIDVNGDCGATSFPGLFRVARLAARSNPPWVISYEQNIPISVCTGIRTPLSQLWPKLRDYI